MKQITDKEYERRRRELAIKLDFDGIIEREHEKRTFRKPEGQ